MHAWAQTSPPQSAPQQEQKQTPFQKWRAQDLPFRKATRDITDEQKMRIKEAEKQFVKAYSLENRMNQITSLYNQCEQSGSSHKMPASKPYFESMISDMQKRKAAIMDNFFQTTLPAIDFIESDIMKNHLEVLKLQLEIQLQAGKTPSGANTDRICREIAAMLTPYKIKAEREKRAGKQDKRSQSQ